MSLLLFTSIVCRMHQCVVTVVYARCIQVERMAVESFTSHRLSVFTLGDATDAWTVYLQDSVGMQVNRLSLRIGQYWNIFRR